MFNVAHKIMVESEICMVKKNLSVAKIKALYVCNSSHSVLKSAMS